MLAIVRRQVYATVVAAARAGGRAAAVDCGAMTAAPPPAGRPRRRPRSPFADAFVDTVSVGVGMFPLGVAFGLLVVQSGLAWWWAFVLGVTVYAGSMEFLAVGLLVAMTPLAQLAATTFLVNFRHVFYALSFPLWLVRGRAARLYSMYALTDESYALTAAKPAGSLDGARVLWLQAFCQTYWVSGSVAGALAGSWLRVDLTGLGFTLTALFIVLAMDAVRVERDVPGPLLAFLCALVALAVAPGQMLVVAMSLYVLTLVGRFLLRPRPGAADA
jgi:4-azaleucine resistance transporter AzlC